MVTLSSSLTDLIRKTFDDLNEDKNVKKWLPQSGENSHWKRCGEIHEAVEFVSGLVDIAVEEFFDSEQLRNFLLQKKLAEEERNEHLNYKI